MKHLAKNYLFPLIVAGADILDVIPRYNAVIDKLKMLESELQKTDAGFDISTMWTCNWLDGELIFDTTVQCQDIILKNELMEIFCNTMGIVV